VQVIIAVEAWEHAYFFDYQAKKADYAANILSGLNWDVIAGRLDPAAGSRAG